MLGLSDYDLLARLTNFEDNFVERKTSSDKKDWLPTAVAFANSVPIGYPAVLFIGVRNDGTPEPARCQSDLDSLQQTFTRLLGDAYPPIPNFPRVLEVNGRQILAVIVPGSQDRPHFAGHAYVRHGSETRKASEEQFARLVAERSSKTYEILKSKGKVVTVDTINVERIQVHGRVAYSQAWEVTDCNQFFVTLQERGASLFQSIPIRRVELSFDHENDRLRLEIYPL